MRVKLTGMLWPPHLANKEFETTSNEPKPSGWYMIEDDGGTWNVNPKQPYGDYGCTILGDQLTLIRTTIEDGLNAHEDSTDILVKILNILED